MTSNEPIILHLPIKKNKDSLHTNTNTIKPFSDNLYDYSEIQKSIHRNFEEKEEDVNNVDENIKIYDSLKKLYDTRHPNHWPIHTNISCWWCCHRFDTIPIPLPEKYDNGKYHVTGCFCSFNCALSYNYNKNDHMIWERESMMRRIIKHIHPSKHITFNFKPSPPKETLKAFGGILSIKDYRDNLITCKKEYNIYFPPIMVLIPQIEEIYANQKSMIKKKSKEQNKKKFIPLSLKDVEKARNNLKLKEKSKRAKNCLEITMGIQTVEE